MLLESRWLLSSSGPDVMGAFPPLSLNLEVGWSHVDIPVFFFFFLGIYPSKESTSPASTVGCFHTKIPPGVWHGSILSPSCCPHLLPLALQVFFSICSSMTLELPPFKTKMREIKMFLILIKTKFILLFH